ncbi:hypothetical protein [Streptomyces sp. NBC_00829]|uniref:hypothetical protein n=1 Tax=Streptomyces sp. NBC_00829 TaxID=2903679 RepID=UPI00386B5AF9|nr:hypothetical protein OG293_34840 [Streptomyces sp. NBC_00829]
MWSTSENGGRTQRYVSHVWEITGIGEDGRPAYNEIFGPAHEWGATRAVPRTRPSPAALRRPERARFDSQLLEWAAAWRPTPG